MHSELVWLTCSFGMGDAAQEDADEPLQGVLVHGVDVGHVCHAEEEDLGVNGHGDVLTAGHVNVSLGLLSHHHFGLKSWRKKNQQGINLYLLSEHCDTCVMCKKSSG